MIAMFYSLFEFVFKDKLELFSITSPLVFCFLVAICLLVFIVLSLISDFKALKQKDSPEDSPSFVDNEDLLRIILFVAGLIVYVLILPVLHYQLSTIILVAVAAFLLNDTEKIMPRLLKALGSAIIFVLAVYQIFYRIFAVILP
jgi:hypothetical protein